MGVNKDLVRVAGLINPRSFMYCEKPHYSKIISPINDMTSQFNTLKKTDPIACGSISFKLVCYTKIIYLHLLWIYTEQIFVSHTRHWLLFLFHDMYMIFKTLSKNTLKISRRSRINDQLSVYFVTWPHAKTKKKLVKYIKLDL